MTELWPCAGTPAGGVDHSVAPLDIPLHGGDLMVMKGKTQQGWHHQVPRQKKTRGARININFRYILPPDRTDLDTTQRGVATFYKYMVSGDDAHPPSFSYHDILKQKSPLLSFFQPSKRSRPFSPIQPSSSAASSSFLVLDGEEPKLEHGVIDLTISEKPVATVSLMQPIGPEGMPTSQHQQIDSSFSKNTSSLFFEESK